MSTPSPSLGLGSRLRQLLAALDGAVQAEYDRRGVPFRPRFYPVVQQLLAGGALSVGALATGAGVSQPAITQTLNEMRRDGLVAAGPGDTRREKLVRLTPKGEALAADLQPLWAAIEVAAARLEAEIGPLSEILQTAGKALEREPFGARIARELLR